jgi:hypothetical protein
MTVLLLAVPLLAVLRGSVPVRGLRRRSRRPLLPLRLMVLRLMVLRPIMLRNRRPPNSTQICRNHTAIAVLHCQVNT